MSVFILLATLVISASALPFNPNAGGRIVGGRDAEIENFPYQVSLQESGEHICGASIISKNYILTAAHCVLDTDDINDLSVRSGSAYHAKGGSNHKVVEQIVYDEADIAVLKIKPPFVFDETRQPIKLVEKTPKVGSLANVTGWGDLEEDGDGPDKLQVVEMPVISNADCSEAYHMEISESELCAGLLGVGGKDACQGDSGGPLAVDNHLAGIVSWGWGCGKPESPGVYVDVAHFSNWIKKQIN